MPTISINRKARHDFTILETYEAGIQLTGAEVKSAKNGHVQLTDSFAKISSAHQVNLYNCYIAPYKPAADSEYKPYRVRRILLHRDEIAALAGKTHGQNLTIVPLRLYTNVKGLIKIELGLAQGKKKYDKRQSEKEKELRKNIAQTLKKYH